MENFRRKGDKMEIYYIQDILAVLIIEIIEFEWNLFID